MAGLTVALLVGVLKDDLLAPHQALGTGGHAVGSVLQSGTSFALVRSLLKTTVEQHRVRGETTQHCL